MNTKHAECETGLERIAGENKATLERLRADMANQKVWLWLFVLVFGAVVTGVTLGIALSGCVSGMSMPVFADWMTLGGVIAILAFLWSLNRDLRNQMADLRDRMAHLEGLFEGFLGRHDKPPPK